MKKIISAIIGIILLILVAVGIRYLLAYNGFLDKITMRKPEMKQYSVIVLENSELKDETNLSGKSVGFLKTDTKAANAEQKLAEVAEIDADFYEDIDVLVEA